jgi:hypothetical protein
MGFLFKTRKITDKLKSNTPVLAFKFEPELFE